MWLVHLTMKVSSTNTFDITILVLFNVLLLSFVSLVAIHMRDKKSGEAKNEDTLS